MSHAPSNTQIPKVLIIDDDPDIIEYYKKLTHKMGYETHGVTNFKAFDRMLQNKAHENISVIVVDMLLPEIDGVEVLRYLAQQKCEAGILLCSSEKESVLKAAGRLAESYGLPFMGYIMKPFDAKTLKQKLKDAIPEKRVYRKRDLPEFGLKEIRRCLAMDEIAVIYQPKIDIKTLKFVSVEALVRWQHPKYGILGPGTFLPFMEQHDMIGTLTTMIMDKAYSQLNEWDLQGLHPNLAINLSARSFNDIELPDQFMSILEKHKLSPSRITLEVTESWANQDKILTLDIMTRLRLKGFQLSIDDFGTGFSSMKQLRELPFTELKLDQSFVRGAADDKERRAIVESCVTLGQNLGLHVVAEGVEKQSDWDLITEIGCNECQGYFIARPMPGENIPLWLDRWNSSLGINSSLAANQ